MRSRPPIEGQFLYDEITRLVTTALKAKLDCFHPVYGLLEKHQIASDWRSPLYTHAQAVVDAITAEERII